MVPVVDLSRRGQRYAAAFSKAAERIAASGSFLLGPELSAFEHEFAEWLGARWCVAVSSGAAALQLALSAAGIGAGDEVLVPAFTAVPTASAVAALGAIPRAIDVDPDTACVSTATVASGRTERSRAVVVVHLYGYPAPLPDTDLLVVEDAAQAHGALHGTRASVATAYSFYPTKNLGGIGDGGAVITDDARIAEQIRSLRVHGMAAQYVHREVSQNFRMSEVEAAWLRLVLKDLAADVEQQRKIVNRYRQAAPHLRWQQSHPAHGYHLAVFRSSERERVRAALADHGVATTVHYPLAITQQPAYRELQHAECGNAETWAAECITVPCFPEMTDLEVEQVCAALAAVGR